MIADFDGVGNRTGGRPVGDHIYGCQQFIGPDCAPGENIPIKALHLRLGQVLDGKGSIGRGKVEEQILRINERVCAPDQVFRIHPDAPLSANPCPRQIKGVRADLNPARKVRHAGARNVRNLDQEIGRSQAIGGIGVGDDRRGSLDRDVGYGLVGSHAVGKTAHHILVEDVLENVRVGGTAEGELTRLTPAQGECPGYQRRAGGLCLRDKIGQQDLIRF